MLGISGLLLASEADERGIVICSDIARYEVSSTAELTQGSGSVGILLEKNPRLLKLNIGAIGYSSEDVDDFFRPLGSTTAKVKAGASIKCYNRSLETSFLDFTSRVGRTPERVLEESDYYVLHTPFKMMPLRSMSLLVQKYMKMDKRAVDKFLWEKGFHDALDPIADVGNIYTGSTFLTLAFLLKQQFDKLGRNMVGKKILIGSYGSGNTMVFMEAEITADAPEVISNWDIGKLFSSARQGSFEEYSRWIDLPRDRKGLNELLCSIEAPVNEYTLLSIREDGYREYR
jgi:hydroxymethylglutaryl-CoA synthase